MSLNKYPIEQLRPDFFEALVNSNIIILSASPGSGKTTQIPWWLASQGQRVWVLEPRRLAARQAATRIAEENKLIIGNEVGYCFRFEKKYQHDTKLVFFTEGTFLKIFQNNPMLDEVDVMIIDEFHERHTETDLALALLLPLVKQRKRPLKLIIMSATLEGQALQRFLPQASFLELTSPPYSLELQYISHLDERARWDWEKNLPSALIKAKEIAGDILLFLPGKWEIDRAMEIAKSMGFETLALHGQLTNEEQQLVFHPCSRTRVICATNVAESSLTLPYVRTVIDSGLAKKMVMKHPQDMGVLQTLPISQAEAIQRAGRANRLGPGLCLRLYTLLDFQSRPTSRRPEIMQENLEDLLLIIKAFPFHPIWLDAPPEKNWEQAQQILYLVGATNQEGELSARGQAILKSGLEIRIGSMLLNAMGLSLGERNSIFKQLTKIYAPTFDQQKRFLHRLVEGDRIFSREFPQLNPKYNSIEACWAHAYIDQLAIYKSDGGGLLHCSGEMLKLHESLANHDLRANDLIVILQMDQRRRVLHYEHIHIDLIFEHQPWPLEEKLEVLEKNNQVFLVEKIKLGAICLEENILPSGHPRYDQEEGQILLAPFLKKERGHQWDDFFQSDEYLQWELALRFKQIAVDWDTLSLTSIDQIKQKWSEQLSLFSPLSLTIPLNPVLANGKTVALKLQKGQRPLLSAPLQDFYGLKTNPTLGPWKIPVGFELLGPRKMPVQITADLMAFWDGSYREVKKELMREYPKHHWADRPTEAPAVRLKSKL